MSTYDKTTSIPSQVDKMDGVWDGFPFLRQPTPVPFSLEQDSIIREVMLEGSSINSVDPQISLYFHGAEQKGTVIIRGGFSPSKLEGSDRKLMRCFPPLPNSAYELTSPMCHARDVKNNRFGTNTFVFSREVVGKGSSPEDSTSIESTKFPAINHMDASSNNLDGAIHQDNVADTMTVAEESIESVHGKQNSEAYIEPPERPVITPTQNVETHLGDARKDKFTVNTTVVANISSSEEPIDNAELPAASTSNKTRGAVLANAINFERTTWVMTTPGVSGIIYSAQEQHEDFIERIDNDDREGIALGYCRKCKTNHIPPGSPITLQDRDTCGAYLPDWFPAEDLDKPWDVFIALHNEIVTADEIAQGYGHKPNPHRLKWDLNFHENSSKLKAAGRRSGWWKCRSGEDAPEIERDCQLCHREKTEEEVVDEDIGKSRPGVARSHDLCEYIDERMKDVGRRDKAIVLARIRAEGWPQHFGVRALWEDESVWDLRMAPNMRRTASLLTLNTNHWAESE